MLAISALKHHLPPLWCEWSLHLRWRKLSRCMTRSYDHTYVTASYWVRSEGQWGTLRARQLASVPAALLQQVVPFSSKQRLSCEVSFHSTATGTGRVVWLQRWHLRTDKIISLTRGLRHRTGFSSPHPHKTKSAAVMYNTWLYFCSVWMYGYLCDCVCRYIIKSY